MICQKVVIVGIFSLLYLSKVVHSQLDNEDAIVGVYMARTMTNMERIIAENLAKSTAEKASASMAKGSLNVQILESLNETIVSDLMGVVACTTCKDAHEIFEEYMDNDKFFVAITETGCERIEANSAVTVPIVENGEDVIQMVSDLRSKQTLTWNDFTVIHDGTIDPLHFGKLMEVLVRSKDDLTPPSVMVLDISLFDSVSMGLGSVFQMLKPRASEPIKRNFLSIVSRNNVGIIQQMARRSNLNGPNYQWLYVLTDTHSLNFDVSFFIDNVEDGDNIAFAYNKSVNEPRTSCNNGIMCVLEETITTLGREVSLALEKELQFYDEVSEEEWQEKKPTAAERVASVVKGLKMQQLDAPSCQLCTEWAVEAVEIMGPASMDLINVLDWRPTGGPMIIDDIFPHVTGGFRGREIVVTSVDYPPWQMINENPGPNENKYSGLIFAVLTEIGNQLNFTYKVVQPKDGKWGALKSGKWNGMIKMVKDKEVLLGAAAFSVSNERMGVVNFTESVEKEPYVYMIAKPGEVSRVLLFIEPFANDTWIWIGITTLIMGPIFFLFNMISPYYDYHDSKTKDRGIFTITNCSWYVFGALLQQGGTKLPDSDSGRLLISFWWIFVIVVVTTYSGNLVAFLTFPQIEESASSLNDLLNNSRTMSWGYLDGSVLVDYFNNADGKYKLIGEQAELHEQVSNALFKRIIRENHAYIEWKSNLLSLMERQYRKTSLCEFSIGKEEFFYENVAFTWPPDSPYIDIFNREIRRLRVAGLIKKWKRDYWPPTNKCSGKDVLTTFTMRTVSMADMQGCFILLILGFSLGAASLIGEFFRRRFKIFDSLPSTPSSTRTIVKSFMPT